MKTGSVFILIFTCLSIFCKAQQVVSSGGYVEKHEITVDWILGGSLGEFNCFVVGNQPKLKNAELIGPGFSIKVYPTLTKDFTTVEITPSVISRLILELYNSSGVKVIDRIVMDQPTWQINLTGLPAGIYFLKVFIPEKDQSLKYEKIVKM
jgi:hypothetical protein